eukprot:scaffold142481_cov118-Phaeocystis_antarctica.AAC.1
MTPLRVRCERSYWHTCRGTTITRGRRNIKTVQYRYKFAGHVADVLVGSPIALLDVLLDH